MSLRAMRRWRGAADRHPHRRAVPPGRGVRAGRAAGATRHDPVPGGGSERQGTCRAFRDDPCWHDPWSRAAGVAARLIDDERDHLPPTHRGMGDCRQRAGRGGLPGPSRRRPKMYVHQCPSRPRRGVGVGLYLRVLMVALSRHPRRSARRGSFRAWGFGWRARIRTWNPLIQSWSQPRTDWLSERTPSPIPSIPYP